MGNAQASGTDGYGNNTSSSKPIREDPKYKIEKVTSVEGGVCLPTRTKCGGTSKDEWCVETSTADMWRPGKSMWGLPSAQVASCTELPGKNKTMCNYTDGSTSICRRDPAKPKTEYCTNIDPLGKQTGVSKCTEKGPFYGCVTGSTKFDWEK